MADQDFNSGFTGAQAVQGVQQSLDLLTAQVGETLYSSGNTSGMTFNSDLGVSLSSRVNIGVGSLTQLIQIGSSVATGTNVCDFQNPNGSVGTIRIDGLTTSYNTLSDPRLKNFLSSPSDEEIDEYFNKVLDSAAVFTWKGDAENKKVWGFDAHKAIDNGLHMGVEGEGPRGMSIGEKYQDAILDDDGNEIEPAKHVTSAAIDQAKDFAALVYKIAQMERKLKEAGVL